MIFIYYYFFFFLSSGFETDYLKVQIKSNSERKYQNYCQILQCLGSKGGCAILTVCTLLYQPEYCLKRLTYLVPMAQTYLNYFWKHSKTKISNPWNVMIIECWFQFLVLTEQQYNMFSSDWFRYLIKLL